METPLNLQKECLKVIHKLVTKKIELEEKVIQVPFREAKRDHRELTRELHGILYLCHPYLKN